MGAVLIAACSAAPPRPASRSATPSASPSVSQVAAGTPGHGGPACHPSQLQLASGPRISEKTEQNTLLLVFRNVSATTCDMRGYPVIALTDSTGRRLSFAYRQGGDQMLTSTPPGVVRLLPGGYAYSALNKNSCVSFAPTSAARAEVTPPGQDEPLVLTLAHYPILSYCRHSGHTIDIAPVEPTIADVLAQP